MEKKIYFLSDLHLGASALHDNQERERKVVAWLDSIRQDCEKIFFLGDVFDFWFEYKYVIPKGYVRFLGKICELADSGVEVHFFIGNHDVWIFDYLPRECGVILHTHNEVVEERGKRLFLGHGDGLNPKDRGFRFIRALFHCRFLQRCFGWLHPDIGIGIARRWSSHSRLSKNGTTMADPYQTVDKEEIEQFCRRTLAEGSHYDYFLFGHRHWPVEIDLGNHSHYINTGDWISHFSYAVMVDSEIYLKTSD